MAPVTLTEAEIRTVTTEAAQEARDCGLDDAAFALLVVSRLRLAADEAALEAGAWQPGVFSLAWRIGEMAEQIDRLHGLVEHMGDALGEVHASVARKPAARAAGAA